MKINYLSNFLFICLLILIIILSIFVYFELEPYEFSLSKYIRMKRDNTLLIPPILLVLSVNSFIFTIYKNRSYTFLKLFLLKLSKMIDFIYSISLIISVLLCFIFTPMSNSFGISILLFSFLFGVALLIHNINSKIN